MNTRPEAQEAGTSELLALSLAATSGDWRWSENGNIVSDTQDSDAEFEIAAVYSEHEDDSEPANSAFICALVNWFRANASTLATPARVVSEEVEYQFEVWQNDECQSLGSAMTAHECGAEAAHYAAMYGQDGPVEVRFYERRQITEAALSLPTGDAAELPEWLPIESAPTEGLHIRGLWVHSLKDGRLKDKNWRAFVGCINDAGRFVDPEYGEDFGWEADDYEAWYALPPAPDTALQPGQGEES